MPNSDAILDANRLIDRKCHGMSIHHRQVDDDHWILELRRIGNVVSEIKLTDDGRKRSIVMSHTSPWERRKHYHDVLLSVLVLASLGNFDFIESTCINWKAAYVNYRHGFEVEKITPQEGRCFTMPPNEIDPIFRSRNQLRQLMSGDDMDETKPWMSVTMRLPLHDIPSGQQRKRNQSIQKMSCT